MLPVIAIRPEPGLSATVERGRKLGLAIERCPLFEVRPVRWEAPDAARFDVLLIGSANAIRHGGDCLERYRSLPVHAVGRSTAEAAVGAGFEVTAIGDGGLQNLLDQISGPRRYLRLAGRAHVALDPPAGTTIETRIVYESAPLPLPEPAVAQLRSGALVLLHSAEAARHFRAEIARLGIAPDKIGIAALGPRIAGAAGDIWAEVRSAGTPDDAALLALARDMCH